MSTHSHFWHPREVPLERTCLWRLGALRLWIQRTESGWRVANEAGSSYEQMNAAIVPHDVVPDVLNWQSIAWQHGKAAFSLRPEMPDRPVIARPEEEIVVPAGESVSYYCLLPCWVRFMLGLVDQSPGLKFSAWPTRVLSGTWFGTHAEGVLGYELAFPAGRRWETLPIRPHHVIVPVRIANESAEHLFFERLCIRTRYLGIFAAQHALWSNAVQIKYHGPNRDSSLHYATGAPSEAGKASAVTPPAEQATRSIVGLSFSSPSSSDFRSNAS